MEAQRQAAQEPNNDYDDLEEFLDGYIDDDLDKILGECANDFQ